MARPAKNPLLVIASIKGLYAAFIMYPDRKLCTPVISWCNGPNRAKAELTDKGYVFSGTKTTIPRWVVGKLAPQWVIYGVANIISFPPPRQNV